ncbi:hypothetical protein AT6N2_C3215 [Agrobacterium tumefaciens]|nr:hypothetical protein AT6N2_C3215 [Agrobacterium tumefaciens]
MATPTLVAETGNRHLVILAAHSLKNMGNGDKPGAGADVRFRLVSFERDIEPFMNLPMDNDVAFAARPRDCCKGSGVIHAEIGELRPPRADIRFHFRKFCGIAHRPDGSGLSHAVALAPFGSFGHLTTRPSCIADGHDIGARAAKPQRAAVVKTDDDIRTVDKPGGAGRQLPISDNRDPPPHAFRSLPTAGADHPPALYSSRPDTKKSASAPSNHPAPESLIARNWHRETPPRRAGQ